MPPPKSVDRGEIRFWKQGIAYGKVESEAEEVRRWESRSSEYATPSLQSCPLPSDGGTHVWPKDTQADPRRSLQHGERLQQLLEGVFDLRQERREEKEISRAAKTIGIENVPVCECAMSFSGPLLESRKESRHISVITDLFTKWVELFPAKTQVAEETVQCIMVILLRYSIPSSLLSELRSRHDSCVEGGVADQGYTDKFIPNSLGKCKDSFSKFAMELAISKGLVTSL